MKLRYDSKCSTQKNHTNKQPQVYHCRSSVMSVMKSANVRTFGSWAHSS